MNQRATARFLMALGSWMLLLGVARAQAHPAMSARAQAPFTFKVSVGSVVLHATVRNRKGELVPGLNQSNFQVYEDGVRQHIRYFGHHDAPVTAGLVIDNSGSMQPKLPEVIAAALAFARASNAQDQLFLVDFNERVWFGLPPDMPFTDQIAPLNSALSETMADGETALYDAVAVALRHLKQGRRDTNVLLVISDGGDDASTLKRAQVMSLAKHSGAIIYAVGIYDRDDPDRNPGALKALARVTGGEAFFPATLAEAVPTCVEIARDIRSQYTLAYSPSNPTWNGKYRSIQVKAVARNGSQLSVLTRTGYYPPRNAEPSPAGLDRHP